MGQDHEWAPPGSNRQPRDRKIHDHALQTSDLVPLLADRGVHLSGEHVYR